MRGAKHEVKPMIENFEPDFHKALKREFEDDGTFPEPSVMCIGVGGGGCNIVTDLNREKESVKMFCLNTDQISNAKRNDINPMTIGMDYIRDKRDSGGFVGVAKKSFKDDSPLIAVRIIKDADLVILVATLGGGTGSGGTVQLVKLLKSEKVPFSVFVVRPFEFEDNRKEVADSTVEELRRETSDLTVFDNNEFNSIREVNRSITETINRFINRKVDFIKEIYISGMDKFLTNLVTEKTLYIDLKVTENPIFTSK